jgi:hypothetical protein
MWISKASGKEDSRFGRFATKWFDFYPAVNIEHRTGRSIDVFRNALANDAAPSERTNAFVSLVFGYSVLTILYQSRAKVSLNSYVIFQR